MVRTRTLRGTSTDVRLDPKAAASTPASRKKRKVPAAPPEPVVARPVPEKSTAAADAAQFETEFPARQEWGMGRADALRELLSVSSPAIDLSRCTFREFADARFGEGSGYRPLTGEQLLRRMSK